MSFSFGFTAANKSHAKALTSEQFAPDIVKHLVYHAVDVLRQDGAIRVKADGHLHDGDDYSTSTVNLKVEPVVTPQVASPKVVMGGMAGAEVRPPRDTVGSHRDGSSR